MTGEDMISRNKSQVSPILKNQDKKKSGNHASALFPDLKTGDPYGN